MQNIDFYDRKNLRPNSAAFAYQPEAEYFSMPGVKSQPREIEPRGNPASRMMFIITALCIISFTAGMVMGLKFAGGAKREIVDKKTAKVMSGLGNRVTDLIPKQSVAPAPVKQAENKFPKEEYPYAIKLDKARETAAAEKIATRLSERGFRVILSRQGTRTRVYVGPYKTSDEASQMLKKLGEDPDPSLKDSFHIIKR